MVKETNCVIHWTKWITQFLAWPINFCCSWVALLSFFFAVISFKLLYSFLSIKSTIKIVFCCCSCCCNGLRALIYSIQELVAIAYDAVQIIKQAQNMEPCLSIKGSAVTSEDRDALFSCMTKVRLNQLFWASPDRKIVVRVFQYVLIFLPFPYLFFFHHNVFMNKLCRKTEIEQNP